VKSTSASDGVLLDVAEIVEDQHLELIELAERARQREIALGGEQLLHEAIGGREVDGMARLEEPVAERARGMRLPRPRQAEGEHVGAALEERAARELIELTLELRRQARGIESGRRLAGRELRGVAEPRDAALATILGLELEDLGQRRECLRLTRGREARLGLCADGGQMERATQLADARARVRHRATCVVSSAS
jgi:hypothetical protein